MDATHFGKLFSRTVDDSIYALPLIVPGLDIAGQRHNVLFVASMGNTVYAFDADDPAQSAPLWSRNLGTPAPGDSWIGPVHHGILGTPFVDVPTGTLYVVALVLKDNDYNLWLNALDIHNGSSKYNSPQLLSFPFAGPEGTLTNVKGALQRAGLLMVNDVLYVAFANIVPDPNDQHWSQEGFLQTFNARDLTQRLAVFQTTPSGRKGGIWQGGRGIATDGLGNIYVSTAGGSYDGVGNFGSSTLKLAGPSLKVADWFTPSNHEYLFLENIDMSAGGVTLIPNSPLMFSGGKEGVIFLLDRNAMGKLEGRDTRAPPEVSGEQRMRPERLRANVGNSVLGPRERRRAVRLGSTGCAQSLQLREQPLRHDSGRREHAQTRNDRRPHRVGEWLRREQRHRVGGDHTIHQERRAKSGYVARLPCVERQPGNLQFRHQPRPRRPWRLHEVCAASGREWKGVCADAVEDGHRLWPARPLITSSGAE